LDCAFVRPEPSRGYFEWRPSEGGRQADKKRITLGEVSDFTPEAACKVADKLRSSVTTGRDPQGDKAAQRKALTVAELAEVFHQDHVGVKRKASTNAHYEDVLHRLVVPRIGRMKAGDVTRADVARPRLGNKGTPFQANRILAFVGSMYRFGSKHGLVPDDMNPPRGSVHDRQNWRGGAHAGSNPP
jgi:hypothetical protein